jgi:predicted HAD superfamily Cof-like phosphohydrolase
MTNEQKQVKDWMQKFRQETPEKPIIPSLEVRRLRLKLIMEKAIKLASALGFCAEFNVTDFTEYPKWTDIIKIADGCEDLKVVTEGTLITCGLLSKIYIGDPLFDEVMKSNNSKFWTGKDLIDKETRTFNRVQEDWTITAVEQGDTSNYYLVKNKDCKVIKPPSYSPPNLEPIIKEM